MPWSTLPKPADVESSEYRAIYEHIASTVNATGDSDDDTIACILNEFVAQSTAMLKTIGRLGSLSIEHFGDSPPVVTWPGGELLDVEFVDGEAERLRELTYREVSVYRTLKHTDMLSDCWFATYYPYDWEGDDAFDVRDLDDPPADFRPADIDPDHFEHMALAWAIESGCLTKEGLRKEHSA